MYQSYFGLRESPFNLTPSARVFFSHTSWREAFATVCYGVEQRKGIIVVTGEAGTGKTTLLKMFVHSANASVHPSCILDPHLNFTELLRCTLTVLGLSAGAGDRLAVAQRFYDYLVEQLAQDHLVVLLLDEAQDLRDEVLNEVSRLSDLESHGAKLLQIIFVGQPEFEAKLERLPFQRLKQRIALRSRLTPLSDEEIGPYIDFRLTAAGYQGQTIFLDAAIERIAFHSKGIPRLINNICDNALLIACATSQNIVGADTIQEAADGLQLGERYASLSASHVAVPPRKVEGVHAGPSDIKVEASVRSRRPFEPPGDESEGRDGTGEVSQVEHADFDPRDGVMSVDGEAQPAEWEPLDGETLASRPGERSAHATSKRSWVGLSVALAALILVVFGVVELHSPRWPELAATATTPVADGMATLKELFAPFPGRIYRVLQAPAPATDSFDTAALEMRSVFNSERRAGADGTQATEKSSSEPNREKEQQPVAAKPKAAITPSRAERASTTDRRSGDTRAAPSSRARFEVVENSYVRNEPSAKAKVVATLRPGMHVQLIRRTGDYLQVRSLEQEAIRGYVHREDAFFRPF